MHYCNQCSKTFASKRKLGRLQENSCTQCGDGLYLFKREQGLKKITERVADDMAIDDGMDPVINPEEMLANKIKDTAEYLIRHDRAKIKELLTKFLDYDENYVVRLGQLVETWIKEQVATEKQYRLMISNIFSGN